jgi:hypothetical protein
VQRPRQTAVLEARPPNRAYGNALNSQESWCDEGAYSAVEPAPEGFKKTATRVIHTSLLLLGKAAKEPDPANESTLPAQGSAGACSPQHRETTSCSAQYTAESSKLSSIVYRPISLHIISPKLSFPFPECTRACSAYLLEERTSPWKEYRGVVHSLRQDGVSDQ